MADLLALSFLQPWLWAIVEGYKPVENRKWPLPARMVGRSVALHASRGWDDDGCGYLRELAGPVAADACAGAPRGAIVATAMFRGAVSVAGKPGAMRELRRVGAASDNQVALALRSRWSFGPWVWVVEDLRRLAEPVPARGALGFWKVPDEVAARVRGLEVSGG